VAAQRPGEGVRPLRLKALPLIRRASRATFSLWEKDAHVLSTSPSASYNDDWRGVETLLICPPSSTNTPSPEEI